MRYARRLLVLVVVLISAACAADSTGTGTPGGSSTLLLQLSTTHTDDGAVLFQVTGPAIDTIVAVNGSLRLFTRRANDSTIVGAVLGDVAAGAVATLRVPAAGATGAYTARVLDVADRQNVLRDSLAGYAMTVTH
ncbi:MAG TPA: hypothetical protein VJ755_12020 [Gemmatimonadales bacterium]|nr:hypothetical protein [Gemmatimonadales bacterium]